jgi:hypothetical protein
VSVAVMNIEVEKEPTVVQIKDFINSFLSIILIDLGTNHNMVSISLAGKVKGRTFFDSGEAVRNIIA